MPTFQIRNRRTKMVLGEVTVSAPERVLDELKDATGSSIEEIAQSLGSTVEEAMGALDIVKINSPNITTTGRTNRPHTPLPPRRLYA